MGSISIGDSGDHGPNHDIVPFELHQRNRFPSSLWCYWKRCSLVFLILSLAVNCTSVGDWQWARKIFMQNTMWTLKTDTIFPRIQPGSRIEPGINLPIQINIAYCNGVSISTQVILGMKLIKPRGSNWGFTVINYQSRNIVNWQLAMSPNNQTTTTVATEPKPTTGIRTHVRNQLQGWYFDGIMPIEVLNNQRNTAELLQEKQADLSAKKNAPLINLTVLTRATVNSS